MITRISTDKNAGNLGTVVNSVDLIFIAEDLVVVFNGSGSLTREGTVDFVGERSNGVEGSSVNSMGVVGVRVV